MESAAEPTAVALAMVEDRELLALYTKVMSEMMARHDADSRRRPQPEDAASASRAAPDEAAVLRTYRLVHDEMLRRNKERPGLWEPRELDGRL